jgi:hypothetical protein
MSLRSARTLEAAGAALSSEPALEDPRSTLAARHPPS